MKKVLLSIIYFLACIFSMQAQILFGTTSQKYDDGGGAIYKFIPATNKVTFVKHFENTPSTPYYTNFIQASDGKLYGMTSEGGSNDGGVIFSIDPSSLAYKKLADFEGTNGSSPNGSLIQASDGKLYGMTSFGGSNGSGVIFSFDLSSSIFTTLKDFDGVTGANPNGSLIEATNGKLYGMTSHGGSFNDGVIFSFDPSASAYAKLLDFNNNAGAIPNGSLIQAGNGKLYGMTVEGGNSNQGVIFSFDPSTSIYAKLLDFDNTNGSRPYGSLLRAGNGKLYGMTSGGGSNDYGAIFSLDPFSLAYTKLKDFDNANGRSPYGSLMQASNGKLYGMTSAGGSNADGVIFSFDPTTSSYTKLKEFDYTYGGSPYGSLIQAGSGKFYGMTMNGGATFSGVIFSFDPLSSTYAKLKNVACNETGNNVSGNLFEANNKRLYGVTTYRGNNGYGVIFSFDPSSSTFTKLKDFDSTNGSYPYGSLMQASNGKLYGMTSGGGNNNFGVIFSFDPASFTYAKLKDFDSVNGSNPLGGLIQASNGKLYGMTKYGGSRNVGVIFSYHPSSATYTKLRDFDSTNGGKPDGSLIQAGNGKLYGVTTHVGSGEDGEGVIFSFDPASSTYIKLVQGDYFFGSLLEAGDGKLYGVISPGDGDNGYFFTFDPSSSIYTDYMFDYEVGAGGGFMQASNGKIYGTTNELGDIVGSIFSFDQPSATRTRLAEFEYPNGEPNSALVEVTGCVAGTTYYRDADGDGYGNPAFSAVGCPIPNGFVANNRDCNDANAAIHPGRAEVCNGIDDDCDGQIDSTTLEAEEAVLNGAAVATEQPGFTGSGYADYNSGAGNFIEWTVNASAAGSFSLQFRYANGGTANRNLKLTINGAVVAASLAFSPTGGWATWSVSSATANLIAGVNKVRLTTVSSQGPNIDHIKVLVGCPPGLLEAELAVFNGAVVTTEQPGYTGSGYADYNSGAGNYIEWTVNAAAAGSYSLQFRYANGGTANRPLRLTVNGAVIAASLAFSPTDGWAVWSVSATTANLTAGVNKVRLTTTGSQGPNVDHLKLEVVGNSTLEAELTVLNGAVIAAAQPGFTGSGYADYNSGSGNYIEWTVNGLSAGYYSLQFRYANGGTANRPLQLTVNGAVVAASLAFSPTGGWAVWSVSSATASLIAGTNKVRLTTIGTQGPNVDHLKVETVTCQPGTLEAELAVLNGAAVTSEQPGFTGSGYADYNSGAGNYIEFTVNASVAGSYSLQFRYANGGTANRALKLTVNGAVVTASLAFAPTGGWAVWSASSATASLIAGTNKVRLTTVGSQGPNVDHLAFSCNTSVPLIQHRPASDKNLLSSVSANILKAYAAPNPVEGCNAKLILSGFSNLPIDVQLVDVNGKNIKSFRVGLNNSNTIDFPVNDLPPGAYAVMLKQGNLTTHARFIVGRK